MMESLWDSQNEFPDGIWLSPIVHIDFAEEIVAGLDLSEPFVIELLSRKLMINPVEA